MVSSAAKTVSDYLESLPPERRAVVSAVRDLVNAHLPDGYRETMAYGMIGWGVPLSRYPNTYNKQPLCYTALAAQKNAYSLYLMCVYADSDRERTLRAAAAAQGKKLNMGKSCLRFKRIDDLPLEAIGEIIASMSVEDFIANYEAARNSVAAGKAAKTASTSTSKPSVAKRAAAGRKTTGKALIR